MTRPTPLRLVPVVLSTLVLGAHFLREGRLAVALVVAALPLLLLARRPFAVRVVQGCLVLGVAVWVSTGLALVRERRELGRPYVRMTLILGAVAAVSAVSVGLLQGMLPAATPRGPGDRP